jgi:hypothetical protein
VCRLWPSSSIIGIGKRPNLVQLLQCPGRPGDQPTGSLRRTTGGVTVQTAAARRTDLTSCGRLTTSSPTLRHASIGITGDIYGHVSMDVSRDALSRLSEALG